MEDFPANSRKARVQDEPVERITSARTVPRKRGIGRQFKETFVGGDARTAFNYMIVDVVVPAIQDTLIDAFQGGIERLIRGESARPRRGMSGIYGNTGRVNYNRMSTGPPTRASTHDRTISRQARARGVFDELIIPSRQEAEEVLDRMYDMLSRYGSVSVAHLYELTGVQSSHTDMKWGWIELRGARAIRQRDGSYLLNLPEPEPLD